MRNTSGSKPTYLLLKNRRRQEWGFPKGHAEFKETLSGAALRECAEECGIGLLLPEASLAYYQTYRVGKNLKATLYVPARTNCTDVTLSVEHDDYHWANLDEVSQYLNHQTLRDLFQLHLDSMKNTDA